MKATHEMCNTHFENQTIEKKRAILSILMELESAEKKFPKWPTKHLKTNQKENKEQYVLAAAIVAEESGELIRASLQFAQENGQYYHMHNEAIQTAAMSIRFLINAHEIPFKEK